MAKKIMAQTLWISQCRPHASHKGLHQTTDGSKIFSGNSSTKALNKSSNKSPPASFITLMHSSETSFITDGTIPAHQFEVWPVLNFFRSCQTNKSFTSTQVTIEPSSFTEEKFALFQSYENHIHKKEETKPSGFRRFLVDTPLVVCRLLTPIWTDGSLCYNALI